MANNKSLNLTIKVNDQEVGKSFKEINSQYYKLRGSINKLEEGTEEWTEANKRLARVEQERKGMIDRQKAFREELVKTTEATDDQTSAMTDFADSASQAFSSLMSGDLIGFQEGMAGVTNGIKSATRAAWAFIATPVGAALAVIAAAAVSAKAIWDYNAALNQMNQELRALGISAQEMDNVRSEVEAVAETYDKEFGEIAKKAKGLSETFGISMSEALDVISRGLADGGKMNSEFMDSLGEYDVFFSEAGYSAQEFIDIVNQGFELGIYSDKLPDAIKEAGLALKEQTTATRDALVNAFGATFADDILSKINRGEMTVKQGLEAIASQAKKTGLTQQQQAQLTADVFKGAGEDAGGAMKILEAVSLSAQRELDATAQSSEKLKEANERLNKVQAELFGIAGFGELWTNIKTASVNAITSILQSLSLLKTSGQIVATSVTNFFIEMANDGITAVQKMVDVASPFLEMIGADIDKIQKSLQSFKIDKVDFVPDLPSIPEPGQKKETFTKNLTYGIEEETKEEDKEEDIEKEAVKRAEKEKAIREKVKSILDEDIEKQVKGIIDAEDPLEAAAALAEKELAQLEETEDRKQQIRKESANKEMSLFEAITNQKKKIQELQVQWTEMTEDQKLSAVRNALGSAAEAFNEGSAAWKAAKISETLIATYQGAQNAFTSLAGIPIVGPALGTAAAALAVTAGLKQVKNISSTPLQKVPKPRGFYRGGYTDMFGMGYKDESGHEVAGVVHKNEYVVPAVLRKDPEVPPILEYLESKRKKVTFASGGQGEGSDFISPAPGALGNNNKALEGLLDKLLTKLDEKPVVDIYFGYEAEQKRQQAEKKLKAIQERSKIK